MLHAAFDAGVTFLDTADAYCLDAAETGHNERLIARALATWTGDDPASRGHQGRAHAARRTMDCRRPRPSLTSACEASLRALGVERIALYQLHAPDPRVPLATSVRALAALRARPRRGNRAVQRHRRADRGSAPHHRIASVQVELSLWHDDTSSVGSSGYCLTHCIPLLAYRPLGGRVIGGGEPIRCSRQIAADHGATPFEIALAALIDLSPLCCRFPAHAHRDGALCRACRTQC